VAAPASPPETPAQRVIRLADEKTRLTRLAQQHKATPEELKRLKIVTQAHGNALSAALSLPPKSLQATMRNPFVGGQPLPEWLTKPPVPIPANESPAQRERRLGNEYERIRMSTAPEDVQRAELLYGILRRSGQQLAAPEHGRSADALDAQVRGQTIADFHRLAGSAKPADQAKAVQLLQELVHNEHITPTIFSTTPLFHTLQATHEGRLFLKQVYKWENLEQKRRPLEAAAHQENLKSIEQGKWEQQDNVILGAAQGMTRAVTLGLYDHNVGGDEATADQVDAVLSTFLQLAGEGTAIELLNGIRRAASATKTGVKFLSYAEKVGYELARKSPKLARAVWRIKNNSVLMSRARKVIDPVKETLLGIGYNQAHAMGSNIRNKDNPTKVVGTHEQVAAAARVAGTNVVLNNLLNLLPIPQGKLFTIIRNGVSTGVQDIAEKGEVNPYTLALSLVMGAAKNQQLNLKFGSKRTAGPTSEGTGGQLPPLEELLRQKATANARTNPAESTPVAQEATAKTVETPLAPAPVAPATAPPARGMTTPPKALLDNSGNTSPMKALPNNSTNTAMLMPPKPEAPATELAIRLGGKLPQRPAYAAPDLLALPAPRPVTADIKPGDQIGWQRAFDEIRNGTVLSYDKKYNYLKVLRNDNSGHVDLINPTLIRSIGN
jgi:hypothetical protein